MGYDFDFSVVWKNWDLLAEGVWLTVRITFISTSLGLVMGMILAGLQRTERRVFTAPIRVYIELVRNTPFLVQLFFIFFGLPALGIKIDSSTAAFIALIFNSGAYATEIIRAGMDSISIGQIEAGRSLGLSNTQILRYVILTPALSAVYPSLTSQFVLILLGSSVISVIAVKELTYQANFLQSRTFRSFEIYLVVTLIYLGLAYFFRFIFKYISSVAFRYERV
jgi:polar amino acid transport system permease protein